MRKARTWLVMSGALAIGAGAAVGVAADLGRDPQSVGPGVQLNPVASSSAVPGSDVASTLATADDAGSAMNAQSPASPQPVSPASPQPVSPASPGSADSPASPGSADSPDSPASPDSAD